MICKKPLPFALFCLTMLLSSGVQAISDHQRQAIERLGALNGIALQCGYFEQTERLKEAMVTHVPKVRALGALFEDATHTSFMSAVKRDNGCPGASAIARDISEGIATLRRVFAEN